MKRLRKAAVTPEQTSELMQVEYVDPADSLCLECQCSFGIHLMSCSKFTPHR